MVEYYIEDICVRYDASLVRSIEGTTISRKQSRGKSLCIELSGRRFHIELHYIHWKNGEIDIRPVVKKGNQKVMSIHDRLRLHVEVFAGPGEKSKYYYCVLRQANVKKNGATYHSNLFDATERQFEDGSGIELFSSLKEFGARRWGTKEKVLHDDGKSRNRLCVIFPKQNIDIVILIFLITRILPVVNNYQLPPKT